VTVADVEDELSRSRQSCGSSPAPTRDACGVQMEKVAIRGVLLAIGVFAVTLAAAFLVKYFELPVACRLGVLLLSLVGVFVFLQAPGMAARSLIVDDFNRMNLRSLITYAWFVTLSGAFVAGSFINMTLWNGQSDAAVNMFLQIPAPIWMLAGVVLTGVVGNGVVDTIHAGRSPTTPPGESVLPDTSRRVNAMYRNFSPTEASSPVGGLRHVHGRNADRGLRWRRQV
jgi:hypothetical protein